MNRTFIIHY